MEINAHYSTLGVNVDASPQQIGTAYAAQLAAFRKRLAIADPLPIERLDALREAYRILSCPLQRRAYDAQQAPPGAAPGSAETRADGAFGAASAGEAAVEFHGSGAEYFRIWLVNIALTLLTIGFYSAWAKVRRERYFHRNMMVDGSSFDYHGTPRAILLGRLVVLAFFLLASLAEYVGPGASLAVSVFGLVAFPWLLLTSIRFRARNTSYRGIRFAFSGSYLKALVLFLVHGPLILLTLGFSFPIFLQRQKAFIANHLSYGSAPLRFNARAGDFYRGLAAALMLWALLLAGAVGLVLRLFAGPGSALGLALILFALPLLGLLFVLLQLVFLPYSRVVGSNLLWNHMQVGITRFRSTQRVRAYLAIALSNWLLILLTLGFFWPLAQIRLAQFRARNLFVVAPQALAEVAAKPRRDASALGSEAMAALDLDIAL